MADIGGGVSVFTHQVVAVLRRRCRVGGFVHVVREGVRDLRNQTMPVPHPDGGLERVVAGDADALQLIDDAEVRELGEVVKKNVLSRRIGPPTEKP